MYGILVGMGINWNKRKYTEQQLRDAVKAAHSWRETARILGVNYLNSGSATVSIKAAANYLELDTSHFTGQGWNQGDKAGLSKRNTIPLSEILVENSTYVNTTNLKRRLIAEGMLREECYAPYCPVPNPSVNPFTGEPVELKLALDHINGVRHDNRLENLRLLCYHCHGLTDTWCRRK